MENTFGAFISSKRLEKSISLRQFAEMIRISPEYLSKIENCERPAPSADILIRMSDKLLLSEAEKEIFFDLAAKTKSDSSIAVDLVDYINKNPTIHKTLRVAKRCNATDEDWQKFADYLVEKNL
jgi:transcriptional regulator with XRE-family HTH domain